MSGDTQPKLYDLDVVGRIRRYIRHKFLVAARDTLELDPDMVGYAIVCWDRKGVCTTTIESKYSPIPAKFVAIIVKDALDRRITTDEVVREVNGDPLPDGA